MQSVSQLLLCAIYHEEILRLTSDIVSHARKYSRSIAYALHVLTYISRLRIHAIFMALRPPGLEYLAYIRIHIHSYHSFIQSNMNTSEYILVSFTL